MVLVLLVLSLEKIILNKNKTGAPKERQTQTLAEGIRMPLSLMVPPFVSFCCKGKPKSTTHHFRESKRRPHLNQKGKLCILKGPFKNNTHPFWTHRTALPILTPASSSAPGWARPAPAPRCAPPARGAQSAPPARASGMPGTQRFTKLAGAQQGMSWNDPYKPSPMAALNGIPKRCIPNTRNVIPY